MKKVDENRFIIGNVVLDFSEKTINITCPKGHLTVLPQSGDVIVRKDHYEWESYFIVDTTTPNVLTRPFQSYEGNYEEIKPNHRNNIVIDRKDTCSDPILVDMNNPHILTRPYPIVMEDDIEHIKEIEKKDDIIREYMKEMDLEYKDFGYPVSY